MAKDNQNPEYSSDSYNAYLRYRALLTSLPVGIYRSTVQGQFLDVNPAMVSILGYDSIDDLMSIYTPDLYCDYSDREQFLNKLEDGDIYTSVEIRMYRKDGEVIWVSSNDTAVKNSKGEIEYFDGVLIDISKRKAAELALQKSEDKYRRLFDKVPIGLGVSSMDGSPLLANEALTAITGYSCSELRLKDLYVDYNDRLVLLDRLQAEGSVRDYRVMLYRKDRSQIEVLINADLETQDGNKIVFVSMRDITDMKRAQSALIESERRFRLQHEHSPLSYQSLDVGGNIRDANPAWLQMMGYKRDEVIGTWFGKFLAEDSARIFKSRFGVFLETGEVSEVQFDMVNKDGTVFQVELHGKVVYNDEDDTVHTHCLLQNVTERKQIEDKLRASLDEKDVLIREIHHRVKNNLQVVSSLLDFHANMVEDNRSKDLFVKCQKRISAMSLVHEQLYESSDMSQISLNDFLLPLINNLLKSYQPEGIEVSTSSRIDDIFLSLDAAIPCGLLVSELVSNALKHAFSNRENNLIDLQVTSKGDRIVLIVRDNGIGIAENVYIQNSTSLGLKLISLLVRQLAGQISVERKNGTVFRIEFPNNLSDAVR